MKRIDGYTWDFTRMIQAIGAVFFIGIPLVFFTSYTVWPIFILSDYGLQEFSNGVALHGMDYEYQPFSVQTAFRIFWANTLSEQSPNIVSWLTKYDPLNIVWSRAELCTTISAVGCVVAALASLPYCGWRLQGGTKQITGRRLKFPPDSIPAANEDLASECERTGTKSFLAPRVMLPWEHEVKGLLLCGAPGSGKTEIIKWLLSQWIKRGSRLIVLDACKGDFTSEWPSEDFYLLAPHDDRSQPGPGMSTQAKAWDLAADCTSMQDAAEFAAQVIQESKEPQWAEGARLILQGAIIGLQRTHGTAWGFRELHQVITLPDVDLNTWMQNHFPEALRYTAIDEDGNASKGAASYLTNCCASVMKFTLPLSHAWGDTPKGHRLSVRNWILSGRGAQAIILARSGQFSNMSAAWIGSLLRLVNSVVQSPALTNDNNRRVMIVLDELRTIASPGDCITALAEVGRSKGIGLVAGIQSYDQLRDNKVWGDAAVDAFEGVMQTKIFGKMMTISSGRGGANAIAENVIGKGRFRIINTTTSSTPGQSKTTTTSTSEVDRLVVEPQFFERLSPTRTGPLAAYLATSSLCLLKWPWSGWTKRRPAVIPARWIEHLDQKSKDICGFTEDDPLGLEVYRRPWYWRIFK